MNRAAIVALAVGLSFPALPVSAQIYRDYHSGQGYQDSTSSHANKNAYEQMMNSVSGEESQEKSNPTYLRRDRSRNQEAYPRDTRSDVSDAVSGNAVAYERMMGRSADKPQDEDDTRRDSSTPYYDVGNYGNVSGTAQESHHDNEEQSNGGSFNRGRDVFVSKEVTAAEKQRQIDLQRGYDSNYQPIRE